MKLLRTKGKTLLFLGVLVLTTITVAQYYLPKTGKIVPQVQQDGNNVEISITDSDGDTDNLTDKNVFQNIIQKQHDVEDTIDPYVELQKVISDGLTYWQNWNWEESMISGVIQSVDLVNNTINIIITQPENREFSGVNKVVYINCEPENSSLIKGSESEQIAQKKGVDILRSASFQDRIYAFCLDEGCLNIGKQCILTDISQ